MSTHTQGNWYYFKYPDNKTFTVAATGSIASKIRSEDDARLIACAPEMLVALKELVSHGTEGPAWRKAKKLIAKAEGADER